jgi:hypothetical protein
MLTFPSANTGTPDGAEGRPPQPPTTPQIATHTSTPERVIAPPESLPFDVCSAIDDVIGDLVEVTRAPRRQMGREGKELPKES